MRSLEGPVFGLGNSYHTDGVRVPKGASARQTVAVSPLASYTRSCSTGSSCKNRRERLLSRIASAKLGGYQRARLRRLRYPCVIGAVLI